MKEQHFGITIETDNFPLHINPKELIACLFANPHITVEKAIEILDSLDRIDIHKFYFITYEQITEVLERQKRGLYTAFFFQEKMRNWVTRFNPITDDDLEYFELKFSIPKEIFGEEIKRSIAKTMKNPREMASAVKQYIKGQNSIIDKISVPFFQHIESKRQNRTCDVKTSFLLAGSTGSGKTELLQRFAEICDVPVIKINTSDCTPNSWRGEHISDMIGYYINEESDLEKLRYSLIIFDEIDKAIHFDRKFVGSNGSDYDADFQRDLLKLFDKKYELVIAKQKGVEIVNYRLPVENFLICFSGAFAGIESIIEKRLNLRPRIGFVQNQNPLVKTEKGVALLQQLSIKDLQEWGFMPELLARISNVIAMNQLSEDIVYEIITTASENILDAHKKECQRLGCNLEFTENVLRKISKMASESGLGVRQVKTILANLMEGVYYDADKYNNTTLTIDDKFFTHNYLHNNSLPATKNLTK